MILAGHGIMLSGAEEEVRRFAETADIPVALTLLGLGAFPASHPLNLGMMGMHGEAWVNQAIQESDLLIALGMRFDDRVTGKLNTYAPKAKKIHVEIDRAEINKNDPGGCAADRRSARSARQAASGSQAGAPFGVAGRRSAVRSRIRRCATSRIFPTTAISTPRT